MIYPCPLRVAMKPERPSASSFFLSRVTLTVSVFSSTKLSVSHSRYISASRLTICPARSISVSRILYSLRVSDTFSSP